MVTRLRYQLYQNKEVCLKLPSAQFMYTVLLNILYVSYQMLFYCSVNNTIIIYYNFSVPPQHVCQQYRKWESSTTSKQTERLK